MIGKDYCRCPGCGKCAAAEEVERLRADAAAVAMIAHSGGLADLSEGNALIAIRRLTLRAWDNSGSLQEIKRRVRAALARAGGGA